MLHLMRRSLLIQLLSVYLLFVVVVLLGGLGVNAVVEQKLRDDEVGNLARSLIRLERDGLKKLGELRTLLETSNAVVRSLEPHAVVGKIIHEVRRLVDVQAAAVLLRDVTRERELDEFKSTLLAAVGHEVRILLLDHFCSPADPGEYLRAVYGEGGHVYASFISLRLHFHQSHTGQSLVAVNSAGRKRDRSAE